ncbi:hypothetical protein ACIBK8_07950 [Streptomyces sp. NPDC050161]|uniref:hypothetical protein n=1 Tax=Streptomyces sp. NPDC050161 TaxID=3365604 RepID=UPI0037A1493D
MTSTGVGRPGRPADPDIEPRVIAATLDVYGAVGWAGVTIVHYVLMATPERRRALHEAPDPFIERVISFVLSGTSRMRSVEVAAGVPQ